MDVDSARVIKTNLAQLFAPVTDQVKPKIEPDNVDSEESLPESLASLPTFSMLREMNRLKSEILKLQTEQTMKPILKSYDEVNKLAVQGLKFSSDISSYLEFIHNSTQVLVQALNDPFTKDALQLPRPLHRKMIDMVDACVWLIQNQRWQASDYELEWDTLLMKLCQEVSDWMLSAKVSSNYLSQIQDFRLKLGILASHYSKNTK